MLLKTYLLPISFEVILSNSRRFFDNFAFPWSNLPKLGCHIPIGSMGFTIVQEKDRGEFAVLPKMHFALPIFAYIQCDFHFISSLNSALQDL